MAVPAYMWIKDDGGAEHQRLSHRAAVASSGRKSWRSSTA